MIFAHGIGGRGDLPIPLWLFSYQAIFALIGSVILLAFFWRKSKLENPPYFEIPAGVLNWGWRIVSLFLRLASLAIFGIVLFASLFGELGSGATIAPVGVYVIFWVGLVLGSALIGNTWQVLSPWDTLSCIGSGVGAGMRRLLKRPTAPKTAPVKILPPSQETTNWLGVFGLFAFIWLELIHPEPASTRLLGFGILLYTIYLLLGAGLWGRSWLRHADTFAILHQLVGSLGIFSKNISTKNKARYELRPPLVGAAQLRLNLPLTAFVLVFLGSTSFDGISNTSWWEDLQDSTGWSSVPLNSLGLIASILIIGVAYFLAMSVAARLTKSNPIELACDFAHSLVPIALAYSVAHYFSLLIFEGQDFVPLLSDPLNQGWDIFGTAHININYLLISTNTIAWIQALSIVIGHIWAIFLAHDRALSRWPQNINLANKSQYPLVGIMVGYTLLGLWLLLNA